jgi:hypothetical protein
MPKLVLRGIRLPEPLPLSAPSEEVYETSARNDALDAPVGVKQKLLSTSRIYAFYNRNRRKCLLRMGSWKNTLYGDMSQTLKRR